MDCWHVQSARGYDLRVTFYQGHNRFEVSSSLSPSQGIRNARAIDNAKVLILHWCFSSYLARASPLERNDLLGQRAHAVRDIK